MSPIPLGRRALVTALASAPLARAATAAAPAPPAPGPVCLFSKHLNKTEVAAMARAVKAIGFDGVDLTVRKDGHVLPERAEQDLPRAVASLRAAGLEVPVITVPFTSAADPAADAVFRAAGKQGIRLARMGHLNYQADDIAAEVDRCAAAIKALADLAQSHGLTLLYQNHVGNFGAPLWDLARVFEKVDGRALGLEFDVRHAVAEGGATAWKTALKLVTPRLRAITLKDFRWQKAGAGWQVENCPPGEGMVPFRDYFALLAKTPFRGPVILHIEYLGQGGVGVPEKEMLAAATRDLRFFRGQLAAAYRGA